MTLNPCKDCSKPPKVADVGGCYPYYEICCSNPRCKNPIVAHGRELPTVMLVWNERNKPDEALQ